MFNATNAMMHAEEIGSRIKDAIAQSNEELLESVRWWTYRVGITKDALHKKILKVYIYEATKRGLIK